MSALELNGNRVAKDNSILARADGSFYDFNGSINYRNYKSLLQAHPELREDSGKYIPPNRDMSSIHDGAAVTKAAQQMKAQFNSRTLDQYLPFYVYERIQSNVGSRYNDELAVFMWNPTLYGSTPGNHYSLAQYRGDERAKWMSVRGSDSKTVESIVVYEDYVYCSFGMGDFLLLKSTDLNFMCFAGDGGAKNSPYVEYMKQKIGTRTIRLIADNDPSGQKTANYLRSYGFKVEVFDWKKLGELSKPKMDLRDLAKMVKSRSGKLSDLKELITQEVLYG